MASPEAALDSVLASSGPNQVDYLMGALQSQTLLGEDASPEGLAASLVHGRIGEQIDAVGQFAPGQDAVHNIDLVNTYASGQAMAKKRLSTASPAAVHVALDMPERLGAFTGTHSAYNIGNFMLALTGRIAAETGSDVLVHYNDGEYAGPLYEGQADDLYDVYRQMQQGGKRLRRSVFDAVEPSLSGLLGSVSGTLDAENEAVVVVSDFRDGFDKQTGAFAWELRLHQLHEQLGDRLWTTRITSPAQRTLPVSRGLVQPTLAAIDRDFADLAARKDARTDQIMAEMRATTVDTDRSNNGRHPIQHLTSFLLDRL